MHSLDVAAQMNWDNTSIYDAQVCGAVDLQLSIYDSTIFTRQHGARPNRMIDRLKLVRSVNKPPLLVPSISTYLVFNIFLYIIARSLCAHRLADHMRLHGSCLAQALNEAHGGSEQLYVGRCGHVPRVNGGLCERVTGDYMGRSARSRMHQSSKEGLVAVTGSWACHWIREETLQYAEVSILHIASNEGRRRTG